MIEKFFSSPGVPIAVNKIDQSCGEAVMRSIANLKKPGGEIEP